MGQYDIRDGKVVYGISDSEFEGKLSDWGGGSFGGDVNELHPRVFTHYHPVDSGIKSSNTYTAWGDGLVEGMTTGSNIRQYDWGTGQFTRTLDDATIDKGFSHAHVWPSGHALFSDAYQGLAYEKFRVWTVDGGPQDFINYSNDWTQGVGNLGTDGVDLVWQYGSKRISPNTAFPVNDVMTSPFTSDPLKLKPRRLRSDGTQFGTTPFIVGCGYGAHASSVGGGSILLVRVSDGRSWVLPAMLGSAWQWIEPLALSCTELFAVVQTKGTGPSHPVIARVRLDSLGAGLPPD